MILDFIGSIFKPASDLVDELHYSDEEKGNIEIKKSELKNKMAEMECKVATKMLDLQSQLNTSNTKMAVAEQQYGNWFTKSVRPAIMIGCFVMLSLMGLGVIDFNQYLSLIYGSFLGVYTGARTFEKKK